MARNLSTAEVARILGMRESRIRQIVRSGFCRPTRRGRRYAFSFQDLVVLRTAQGLLECQVPLVRVRRALASLSEQLPADRTLAGVRIVADGRDVAVCDGDTRWRPETGQILLQFGVDELARGVDELARGVEPLPAPRGAGGAGATGEQDFARALELEDDDPVAACAAYRRALALDADLVDAYVNLGRLRHEAGDPQEAARLYRQALERSPDDALIHFNLALALEDTKGVAPATVHYERALALDPDFADAHYNLAGLYEQLGRGVDALRHYHAYKKLTRD